MLRLKRGAHPVASSVARRGGSSVVVGRLLAVAAPTTTCTGTAAAVMTGGAWHHPPEQQRWVRTLAHDAERPFRAAEPRVPQATSIRSLLPTWMTTHIPIDQSMALLRSTVVAMKEDRAALAAMGGTVRPGAASHEYARIISRILQRWAQFQHAVEPRVSFAKHRPEFSLVFCSAVVAYTSLRAHHIAIGLYKLLNARYSDPPVRWDAYTLRALMSSTTAVADVDTQVDVVTRLESIMAARAAAEASRASASGVPPLLSRSGAPVAAVSAYAAFGREELEATLVTCIVRSQAARALSVSATLRAMPGSLHPRVLRAVVRAAASARQTERAAVAFRDLVRHLYSIGSFPKIPRGATLVHARTAMDRVHASVGAIGLVPSSVPMGRVPTAAAGKQQQGKAAAPAPAVAPSEDARTPPGPGPSPEQLLHSLHTDLRKELEVGELAINAALAAGDADAAVHIMLSHVALGATLPASVCEAALDLASLGGHIPLAEVAAGCLARQGIPLAALFHERLIIAYAKGNDLEGAFRCLQFYALWRDAAEPGASAAAAAAVAAAAAESGGREQWGDRHPDALAPGFGIVLKPHVHDALVNAISMLWNRLHMEQVSRTRDAMTSSAAGGEGLDAGGGPMTAYQRARAEEAAALGGEPGGEGQGRAAGLLTAAEEEEAAAGPTDQPPSPTTLSLRAPRPFLLTGFGAFARSDLFYPSPAGTEGEGGEGAGAAAGPAPTPRADLGPHGLLGTGGALLRRGPLNVSSLASARTDRISLCFALLRKAVKDARIISSLAATGSLDGLGGRAVTGDCSTTDIALSRLLAMVDARPWPVPVRSRGSVGGDPASPGAQLAPPSLLPWTVVYALMVEEAGRAVLVGSALGGSSCVARWEAAPGGSSGGGSVVRRDPFAPPSAAALLGARCLTLTQLLSAGCDEAIRQPTWFATGQLQVLPLTPGSLLPLTPGSLLPLTPGSPGSLSAGSVGPAPSPPAAAADTTVAAEEGEPGAPLGQGWGAQQQQLEEEDAPASPAAPHYNSPESTMSQLLGGSSPFGGSNSSGSGSRAGGRSQGPHSFSSPGGNSPASPHALGAQTFSGGGAGGGELALLGMPAGSTISLEDALAGEPGVGPVDARSVAAAIRGTRAWALALRISRASLLLDHPPYSRSVEAEGLVATPPRVRPCVPALHVLLSATGNLSGTGLSKTILETIGGRKGGLPTFSAETFGCLMTAVTASPWQDAPRMTEMLGDMKAAGLAPNARVYSMLATLLVREGRADKAAEALRRSVAAGVPAFPSVFVAVVKALAREHGAAAGVDATKVGGRRRRGQWGNRSGASPSAFPGGNESDDGGGSGAGGGGESSSDSAMSTSGGSATEGDEEEGGDGDKYPWVGVLRTMRRLGMTLPHYLADYVSRHALGEPHATPAGIDPRTGTWILVPIEARRLSRVRFERAGAGPGGQPQALPAPQPQAAPQQRGGLGGGSGGGGGSSSGGGRPGSKESAALREWQASQQ